MQRRDVTPRHAPAKVEGAVRRSRLSKLRNSRSHHRRTRADRGPDVDGLSLSGVWPLVAPGGRCGRNLTHAASAMAGFAWSRLFQLSADCRDPLVLPVEALVHRGEPGVDFVEALVHS